MQSNSDLVESRRTLKRRIRHLRLYAVIEKSLILSMAVIAVIVLCEQTLFLFAFAPLLVLSASWYGVHLIHIGTKELVRGSQQSIAGIEQEQAYNAYYDWREQVRIGHRPERVRTRRKLLKRLIRCTKKETQLHPDRENGQLMDTLYRERSHYFATH